MIRATILGAVAGLSNGHGLMWKPWSRANIAENNGWEADSTSIISEPQPEFPGRSYPGNRPWAEPGKSLSFIGPCGSKSYGSQTDWNKPEHGWGTEVTATYNAGDIIDVEWCVTSAADHGGSYRYSLCQDESITAKFINPDYKPTPADHAEMADCFERGTLSCHDVPGQNCRVHPSCQSGWGCMQASSWFHCEPHMSLGGGSCLARSIGSCREGRGGLIRDQVRLPDNFASNHTLMQFRWDCQQTAQLWLNCADIKILRNGQPAPPTPAPAPTPAPPTPAPGQCSVAESNRRDCGFSGIDENGCNARDCCWKSSGISGVPWCFYKEDGNAPSPPANTCDVPEYQRADCGYFGIDQSGCENKGCCWRQSSSGAPWCYYRASSAAFIQNAQKRGGKGSMCSKDVCRDFVPVHAHAKHAKDRTQVCQKVEVPC